MKYLKLATILIFIATGAIASPADSTTKGHVIIWDRNTENDVEYYNIYLIQPITKSDTLSDSTRWIYTRIGTAVQPAQSQDSVMFQVNQVNNTSVVFAFTVTAVDHAGNQSGYARNRDNPALRRTRWIYGLPPGAPTGLRIVTVALPDSIILMIMEGQIIDMEVFQKSIIKVKE